MLAIDIIQLHEVHQTCRLKAHEAVLRQKHEAALANSTAGSWPLRRSRWLSAAHTMLGSLFECLSQQCRCCAAGAISISLVSRWCACMTYDVLRAPLVPLQCPSGAFRLT